MKKNTEDIFEIIYHEKIIAFHDLEILTGQSQSKLRPSLEELKELGYIIENKYVFEISKKGIIQARTLWA